MTAPAGIPRVRVEIWSDVVCPWCYIGKRRFESAVEELRGEVEVDAVFRPFQLDPRAAPGASQPVREAYERKFGGPAQASAVIDQVTAVAAGDGIELRLDRALRANTLLAHRLLWWAEQPGSTVTQAAVKERLLQAYFVEGLDVGDPDTLADCIAELGPERADVVDFLESDRGADEVAAMLRAASESGITAVPTFVVAGGFPIPGAQDPDTFVKVLRRIAERAVWPPATDGSAPTCTDDACGA